MIKYIFIAVNYNNATYTLKYIESIRKLLFDRGSIEIIIVDNNSSLSDFKLIETAVKGDVDISLIRNQYNVGYFGALNVGLDSVKEKQNRIFIVGNNDLEFDNMFLVHLEKIEYDHKTLAIAPNIITRNGFHQNPLCINRISAFRKFCYKIYYTNYYLGQIIYWLIKRLKLTRYSNKLNICNKQLNIYMGIGACYVLTKHFFDSYTRLDDRVFLWGEEALFAGQVLAAEGKILYDPDIVVYHNESTSVSKIPSKKLYVIQRKSFKIFSRYL